MAIKWILLASCLLGRAFGAEIGSQYRSDFLLSNESYPEPFNQTTEGGRIHYTIHSRYTIKPEFPLIIWLTVNGFESIFTLESGRKLPKELNWMHCDISESQIFWISMHTSSDAAAKSITHIKVKDQKSLFFVDTDLPPLVKDYPVRVTYVTTTNAYSKLVVHVHNYSDQPKIVQDVIVDGESTNTIFYLAAGQHRVLTFPTEQAVGGVWTVNLKTTDGVLVGNGGRIIREHFPIIGWQHSKDCPFPETNMENFEILTERFLVDDFMFFKGYFCDVYASSILDNALSYNYSLLVNQSLYPDNDPNFKTDSTAAIYCGETEESVEGTLTAWNHAIQQRVNNPSLPTYQTGQTYTFAGAFSGITDIQGKYFFVAGCGPHVTTLQSAMRIQGAYDYLKNTRDNQMPLPTWSYSQFRYNVTIQPNANEVMVQLASVVAAGAKGLMLFKVDPQVADPDWQATVVSTLKPIKTLSEDFRVGDIEGATFSKDDDPMKSTVAIVRSLDKLIVVVINTNADGYNDVLCYSNLETHWQFKPHTIQTLEITLPLELVNANTLLEVTEQGIVQPIGVKASFVNGQAILQRIALGVGPTVVRFFVIQD